MDYLLSKVDEDRMYDGPTDEEWYDYLAMRDRDEEVFLMADYGKVK